MQADGELLQGSTMRGNNPTLLEESQGGNIKGWPEGSRLLSPLDSVRDSPARCHRLHLMLGTLPDHAVSGQPHDPFLLGISVRASG